VGSSEAERRVLSDDELTRIVRAQIEERTLAAREYERLGHRDQSERLRREVAVLSAYMHP
jgi:uncharacterized protein